MSQTEEKKKMIALVSRVWGLGSLAIEYRIPGRFIQAPTISEEEHNWACSAIGQSSFDIYKAYAYLGMDFSPQHSRFSLPLRRQVEAEMSGVLHSLE